jgi:hypothetical protein
MSKEKDQNKALNKTDVGGSAAKLDELKKAAKPLRLHYYNEIILQTPIGNLHMRAGSYMSSSRKIGKQHQNILVFYKGNPKKIKEHFKSLKNESTDME